MYYYVTHPQTQDPRLQGNLGTALMIVEIIKMLVESNVFIFSYSSHYAADSRKLNFPTSSCPQLIPESSLKFSTGSWGYELNVPLLKF